MDVKMILSADTIMKYAQAAYEIYSQTDKRNKRASFFREISARIERHESELASTAAKELRLSESCVLFEFGRVISQLRMFASLLEEGSWVEASIDTEDLQHKPLPQSDVRRMMQPIGPVAILSGGNSPFAFFDVINNAISALAAGSAVVIKADTKFIQTLKVLFELFHEEMKVSGVPLATVQYITGSETLAKDLVQHPLITGIAYTGTVEGSRVLTHYAMKRSRPIPVFADMSSLNPVVIYPEYLQMRPAEIARKLSYSVMLDAGQHSTNPRLILVLEGYGLSDFINELEESIYQLEITATRTETGKAFAGSTSTTIMKTTGYTYLQKNISNKKIPGTYALLIICRGSEELKTVLKSIDDQLTTTIMATEQDMARNRDIVQLQQLIAGRIIVNEMPAEERICYSMIHGGAYPSASDPRYTSSGILAIKRWVRPVCYQNFPQQFLPDELKNDNPLHIARVVNKDWKHSDLVKVFR